MKPTFEIPPHILSIETIRIGDKKILMIGEEHESITPAKLINFKLMLRLVFSAAMRETENCVDFFLERPFGKQQPLYFAGGEFRFPAEQLLFADHESNKPAELESSLTIHNLSAAVPWLKDTFGERLRIHNADPRLSHLQQDAYETFEFDTDVDNSKKYLYQMNWGVQPEHRDTLKMIRSRVHQRHVIQHATSLSNTTQSILFDWHKWRELDVPLANRPLAEFRSLHQWERHLRCYAELRVEPVALEQFFLNQIRQLRRIIATRQRIRKEWEKIDLPVSIKTELLPRKFKFRDFREKMPLEMDFYTFYRMLMTFRDERCPSANTIIYYAGHYHIENMQILMKRYARVIGQPFHFRRFYSKEFTGTYNEQQKVSSPKSFAPVLRAISDWLAISYVRSNTPFRSPRPRKQSQSNSAQTKRTKRRATEDDR